MSLMSFITLIINTIHSHFTCLQNTAYTMSSCLWWSVSFFNRVVLVMSGLFGNILSFVYFGSTHHKGNFVNVKKCPFQCYLCNCQCHFISNRSEYPVVIILMFEMCIIVFLNVFTVTHCADKFLHRQRCDVSLFLLTFLCIVSNIKAFVTVYVDHISSQYDISMSSKFQRSRWYQQGRVRPIIWWCCT